MLELEAKASEGDVAAATRRVQAMTGGEASPRRSPVAGRLVGTSDWRRAAVASNTPKQPPAGPSHLRNDAPPPYGASHSPRALGGPPEFEAPHFSPPGERRSGVAAGLVVATQHKVCEDCTFKQSSISAVRCDVCSGERLRLCTVQVPPVASQAQQWRQSPG